MLLHDLGPKGFYSGRDKFWFRASEEVLPGGEGRIK
jgi:hypothetical protein